MLLKQIFDPGLAQYTYLIGCQATGEAILIDPERDVDRYLKSVEEQGLRLVAVAETHIHADFLSGARELAEQTGARLYLSSEGESSGWGSKWAENYTTRFVSDGDVISIGNIELKVVSSPGHTPEHISFLVIDRGAGKPRGMLTGDFLFVGDVGRPDLLEAAAKQADTMKSSAQVLFQSLRKIVVPAEHDHLIVWPAHGAGSSCGKGLSGVPHSSFGYEKSENPSLKKAFQGEAAFIEYILKDQPDPPLYFARMKALNRDGVPLLSKLPVPEEVSPKQAISEGWIPIDTRPDRAAFLNRHLPGSLYAPDGSVFSTAVGSLLEDPEHPIVLIGETARKEELVRRLVRIGYEKIAGFISTHELRNYFDQGGSRSSIPSVDLQHARDQETNGAAIIDVRYTGEYRRKHLSNAIHAPYTRLPEYLDKIPMSKPLMIHCHSGFRASMASAYLSRIGYTVTHVDDILN